MKQFHSFVLLPVFNNSTSVHQYNCATILPYICYLILVAEIFDIDWSSFLHVSVLHRTVSGSDRFYRSIVLVLNCTLGWILLLFILSRSLIWFTAASGNCLVLKSCIWNMIFINCYYNSIVLHSSAVMIPRFQCVTLGA